MPKIRMLETQRGSIDGRRVHLYMEGHVYTLPDDPGGLDLAAVFLREGWAEAVPAKTEGHHADAIVTEALVPHEARVALAEAKGEPVPAPHHDGAPPPPPDPPWPPAPRPTAFGKTPVVATKGDLTREFGSVAEACKELKLARSQVNEVLAGRRQAASGWHLVRADSRPGG